MRNVFVRILASPYRHLMRTTVNPESDVIDTAQEVKSMVGDGVRFATFNVPANAPIILASRIQKILDDDGAIRTPGTLSGPVQKIKVL
jgi:hypothetical protein